MNINIADNLKRLRKQSGITQEDLANFIGVSFQAVSKWERGEGYPDITILPTIANYFDVTLDEFVGMNEIKNEARLEEIFKSLRKNASVGNIKENIKLLREEIKCFPNNYQLLLELAHYLIYDNDNAETEKKNNSEAIEICKRILDFCTDSNIRISAQKFICFSYSRNGDDASAAKEAELLPDFWDCKEIIRASLLNGKELIHSVQTNISSFIAAINLEIYNLADVNCQKGLEWTNAERIAMIDKSNKLYELIYENGDYHFNSINVSTNYRTMAAFAINDGNKDQTIDYLEKAVEYAIVFDTLPDKIKHTSLLVNDLEHETLYTSKNFQHSLSKATLDKMQEERYDVIRNDERFITMVKKLKGHI